MPYSSSSELGTRTVLVGIRFMMDPSWDEPGTSTMTRLRCLECCTIRGAVECDSASPTSIVAPATSMFWSDEAHGASLCSARQQRSCAFATTFGRQTDRTASGRKVRFASLSFTTLGIRAKIDHRSVDDGGGMAGPEGFDRLRLVLGRWIAAASWGFGRSKGGRGEHALKKPGRVKEKPYPPGRLKPISNDPTE